MKSETRLRLFITGIGLSLLIVSLFLSGEWQCWGNSNICGWSPIGEWDNNYLGFWGWSDVFGFFGVGFLIMPLIFWKFIKGGDGNSSHN